MRLRQIPYLDDLRAFEAVARLGSVRAAGQELSITHAAVSRRIKRLGEGAGAALFERHGRGLRLTSAGQQMYDCCTRAFANLEETTSKITTRNSADDPVVLLSCERSVAMRWLIPRLNEFEAKQPTVKIHLSVGGGTVDADGNRPTLALRRLDFRIPAGWEVLSLFKESVGPVMAPELFESFQRAEYTSLGSKTRSRAWDDWLAENPGAPRPSDNRMLDHHFLMVEAACSGLGVALCPRVVAVDDIDRGRLIAPLGFTQDGSEYGVLYPSRTTLSNGARQLMLWLHETMCDL